MGVSSLQFALSTRAGTECVSHLIRALTDLNPEAIVVSVDEIGAYDLMRRKAMLGKLRSKPKLCALLPFAKLSYGASSQYWWRDAEGKQHEIRQGKGEEHPRRRLSSPQTVGAKRRSPKTVSETRSLFETAFSSC